MNNTPDKFYQDLETITKSKIASIHTELAMFWILGLAILLAYGAVFLTLLRALAN